MINKLIKLSRGRKNLKKSLKYMRGGNEEFDDLSITSLKNVSREKESSEIKNDFKKIDADNSGYIDLKELQKGLKKYGLKLSIVSTEKLLKKYDDTPDNKIDIQEFVKLKRDLDSDNLRRTKKNSTKKEIKKKKKTRNNEKNKKKKQKKKR